MSDVVDLSAAVGVAVQGMAISAAQAARHGREMAHAQRWVDHLGAEASAAQADFLALAAELRATRLALAEAEADLADADAENAMLCAEVGRLRRAH